MIAGRTNPLFMTAALVVTQAAATTTAATAQLATLAIQKPRRGYRRLHWRLERDGVHAPHRFAEFIDNIEPHGDGEWWEC